MFNCWIIQQENMIMHTHCEGDCALLFVYLCEYYVRQWIMAEGFRADFF